MYRDTPIRYKTATTGDTILLPHTLNEEAFQTLWSMSILCAQEISISPKYLCYAFGTLKGWSHDK